MEIPTAYIPGYERARAIDPETASNYVAHATVGDPEADALMDELSSLSPREADLLIQAGMDDDQDVLRDAPPTVRAFFEKLDNPPDWVDYRAFIPGIRMFHRNSKLILGAFVGGTLVEGFSTNISKSFFITGRLRDQGVRRLKQNNRHMIEIFMPGGLGRDGDGLKLSVRVRLVHAQLRRLLRRSDEWDVEAWGLPISSAHLGFAITAFSARLLIHMKNLGSVIRNEEERRSFMAVWRYAGYLMGIPETILFHTEEDALHLFHIGGTCEPTPELESIAMANSLANSAPLVIGIDDPVERRKLAKYVFSISRALIGNELANELMYPPGRTIGILRLFRMDERYHRLLGRLFPKRSQNSNFARFTGLLEASAFDEAGHKLQNAQPRVRRRVRQMVTGEGAAQQGLFLLP